MLGVHGVASRKLAGIPASERFNLLRRLQYLCCRHRHTPSMAWGAWRRHLSRSSRARQDIWICRSFPRARAGRSPSYASRPAGGCGPRAVSGRAAADRSPPWPPPAIQKTPAENQLSALPPLWGRTHPYGSAAVRDKGVLEPTEALVRAVWWAREELNLRPLPCQQMQGTAVLSAVPAGRV